MTTSDDVDVVRNDDAGQYEIRIDGELAGVTTFHADEQGNLVFPHTVIEDAHSGRGLGTTLVSEALADAARRGETVVPVCPFVIEFLQDNEVPGLLVSWPDGVDAADAAAPAEPA